MADLARHVYHALNSSVVGSNGRTHYTSYVSSCGTLYTGIRNSSSKFILFFPTTSTVELRVGHIGACGGALAHTFAKIPLSAPCAGVNVRLAAPVVFSPHFLKIFCAAGPRLKVVESCFLDYFSLVGVFLPFHFAVVEKCFDVRF